jgi:endogenous inhibitor of DNA gyrase (YacG/DUF329 family)
MTDIDDCPACGQPVDKTDTWAYGPPAIPVQDSSLPMVPWHSNCLRVVAVAQVQPTEMARARPMT